MELNQYVAYARENGLSDQEIATRLLQADWSATDVYRALESDPKLVPPAPQNASASSQSSTTEKSDDSVNITSGGFSARGFEYLVYFISLGIVALSFGALLHNIVNLIFDSSKYSYYQSVIPVATAGLIVTIPIYIYLMLRLRKAEDRNPKILQDKTRRRGVQFLMLVTFIIGIVKLIAYVFNIIEPAGPYDYEQTSILAETLHAMITIGLAGGIFAKYWREQANSSD